MTLFSTPAGIDDRQAMAGLLASLVLVSGISVAARVFLKDSHVASAQEGTICTEQTACPVK